MYTYYNDRKEPTRETGHCAAALSGVKPLQGPLCASAGQVLRGCSTGAVGVGAEGGYRGEGTPVDRIRFSARGRHRCYCVISRRSGKPDEINIRPPVGCAVFPSGVEIAESPIALFSARSYNNNNAEFTTLRMALPRDDNKIYI